MKLKKSSGPLKEASQDIADELDTSPSTVRNVGVVAGVIVAISAIAYVVSMLVTSD